MKPVLAALLFMVTTPVAAQEIGYEMDRIKAGSTITFKNFENMVNTHVFDGKIGGEYVYRTHDGPDATHPLMRTRYTNAKGELLRVEHTDGRSFTFKPHNCVRTIGSCSYVEVSNSGRVVYMTRQTEVDGQNLTFSVTYNRSVTYYTGTSTLGPYRWPMLVTVQWKTPIQEDTEKVLSTNFK